MSQYIKKAKKQGKTVTDIISKSNVGRTSFYAIMSGSQIPKIDTATRIAESLNASLEEIFPKQKKVMKND